MEEIEQLRADNADLQKKVDDYGNQIWILEQENDELKANDQTDELRRLLNDIEKAQEREREMQAKIERLERLVNTRDNEVIERTATRPANDSCTPRINLNTCEPVSQNAPGS